MSILDHIIEDKKKQIARLKPLSSVERFEREGFFWQIRNRSLVESLLAPGSTGIIAEFKRRSPSKGEFKSKSLEVEPVIRHYNKSAAGISILTDEPFFGGDLDDLIQAKVITDIPVLRKDFIIDPWQIAESKAFGADVILLIAACLTKDQVQDLSGYARSIGLEVLLEVHNELELGHICDTVDLVGVNNRDLTSFEVKVETSLGLISQIPKGIPAISESGLTDTGVVTKLRHAGFRGFLIGETFMREENPGVAFEEFISELKQDKPDL